MYPLWWLLIFLALLGFDLLSKKWMTNHLNFFLNSGQLQQFVPEQDNWALAGFRSARLTDLESSQESSASSETGENAQNPQSPYLGVDQINVLGDQGKWLKFRLLFNDRFIFGLGPNTPILGFLLTAFATIGLFIIRILYYSQTKPISWALIFAGAVGNLIDKMFLKSLTTREWTLGLIPEPGYVQGVVDFVEVIWFGAVEWQGTFLLQMFSMRSWPSFNLADSYIVVGVIWLILRFK